MSKQVTTARLIELRDRYNPHKRAFNTSIEAPYEVERTGRDIFMALSELIEWRNVLHESERVRGVEPGDMFGDPVEVKS